MNKIDLTLKDVPIDQVADVLARIQGVSNVTIAPTTSTVVPQPPVPALPKFFTHVQPQAPVLAAQSEEDDETPAANSSVAGRVDKNGLPWDERIHSGNQKLKADGSWTRRKNVAEAYYKQVEAELRGLAVQPVAQVAPAPLPPIPQPPAPPAPVAPAQIPLPPVPPAYPQVPQPPAPPAPTPPAPVAPAASDIGVLMNRLQACFQAATADGAYLTSLLQRVGQAGGVQVNAINDLAPRPDLIKYAMDLMTHDGKQ